MENNKTIDCLEEIKDLLIFESEDDFYFLQILQRKKDNTDLGSNSRVIKNYYIKSIQHLEDKYDEIKSLCNLFNARASLRLNRRSFESVGFKTLENIANTMQNREYKHLAKSYDRACGLLQKEKTKKWIVDVDKDEMPLLEQIIQSIKSTTPTKKIILKQLTTRSGVHLITLPFNVMEFRENLDLALQHVSNGVMAKLKVDVHKDNPINLYIPEHNQHDDEVPKEIMEQYNDLSTLFKTKHNLNLSKEEMDGIIDSSLETITKLLTLKHRG